MASAGVGVGTHVAGVGPGAGPPYLFPRAGGQALAPGRPPPRQTPPAGGCAAPPPPRPSWAEPGTGRGTGGTCAVGKRPGKVGERELRSLRDVQTQGSEAGGSGVREDGALRAGRAAGPKKTFESKVGTSEVGQGHHTQSAGRGDEGRLKSCQAAPPSSGPRAGALFSHAQRCPE